MLSNQALLVEALHAAAGIIKAEGIPTVCCKVLSVGDTMVDPKTIGALFLKGYRCVFTRPDGTCIETEAEVPEALCSEVYWLLWGHAQHLPDA